ncbi:MAG: DUF4389 domain-containing protein, partial [Gammaproteobacteria bacterium]|nr:DUF4389 domain-containing protein [Gammaproteobacteria bacterium]
MTEQEKKPVISPDVKARLKDQSIWLYFLQLIMYGIAFGLCAWILLGVSLLHFLLRLLTGEPNSELQKFGQNLA